MTENHTYDTPMEGSLDWHIPLNNNFRKIDTDTEIRDKEAERNQYTPKAGAKFFATDTGKRYLGDGSQWNEGPTQSRSELVLPKTTSDPTEPSVGQLWFRSDLDELRSNVGGTIVTLATGGTSSGSDISEASVQFGFDDYSWESKTDLDEVGRKYRGSIVDAPGGRGQALRINIPEGEHFGSKFSFWFDQLDSLKAEHDEMWSQHYIYFDDSWNFGTDFSNGGKLPGFAGKYSDCGDGGDPCDGTDGWTARMAHRPPEASGDLRLGHYVYHADMTERNGDTFLWDEAAELSFNTWYRIDQRVVMNTPGQNDGIIQGWVDGTLAQNKQDLKFRDDGYDNIKINSFKFNTFMGGGWVSTQDAHCYYDDLAMGPSQFADSLEQV